MGTMSFDQYTFRPVLLDGILDGRPRASTSSRLLSLPAELLADIVERLSGDKASLANLALVNSDCRSLACSVQFMRVHFRDCRTFVNNEVVSSPSTLMQHIATHYMQGDNRQIIARCIRQVTVERTEFKCASMNSALFHSIRGDAADTTAQDRDYNQKHHHQFVMQALLAMPNLSALAYGDGIPIDPSSFCNIMCLPISHLKLYQGCTVNGRSLDFSKIPPILLWRTLNLRLSVWSDVGEDEIEKECRRRDGRLEFSICMELFRRCSMSIETLTWKAPYNRSYRPMLTADEKSFLFPRLRRLLLGMDSGMPAWRRKWILRAGRNVTHLELPKICGSSNYLLEDDGTLCTYMPNLQHLLFGSDIDRVPLQVEIPYQAGPHMEFLKGHTSISKLTITETPDHIMNDLVMPTLASTSFANLTCLYLHWYAPLDMIEPNSRDPKIANIPHSTFAILGSGNFSSLEYLALGARKGNWRYSYWPIDHALARTLLAPGLPRLKQLFFKCNTGQLLEDTNPFQYYRHRSLVGDEEEIDAFFQGPLPFDQAMYKKLRSTGIREDRSRALEMQHHWRARSWERAHKYRMRVQGTRYAECFPKLEFIFCGQWPMEIRWGRIAKLAPPGQVGEPEYRFARNGEDPDPDMKRMAWPAEGTRCLCEEYMENIFGIPGTESVSY